MGAGLTSPAHHDQGPCQHSQPPAKLASSGKGDHVAGPRAWLNYRTDGHCRRSSRPNCPLFSGLLGTSNWLAELKYAATAYEWVISDQADGRVAVLGFDH